MKVANKIFTPILAEDAEKGKFTATLQTSNCGGLFIYLGLGWFQIINCYKH